MTCCRCASDRVARMTSLDQADRPMAVPPTIAVQESRVLPIYLMGFTARASPISTPASRGSTTAATLASQVLSKRVGQVLDAMPVTWLVALQLYRVFGSWALASWLRGALPGNAQERLYAVERALPDCEVLLHTLPTLP